MFSNVCFLGLGILPCLLFFVLLLTQWNTGSQVKYSLAYSYILRIAGILLTIIKYLLFQPIINVLSTSFWCSPDIFVSAPIGYTCYSTEHIVLLFFSAFTMLLLIALSAISIVLFSDEQLDSKLPWAGISQMYDAYKICWKIAISLMLHITKSNTNVGAFAPIPSIIFSIFGLYELYKLAYMNDKKVYYALFISESVLLWFSFDAFLDILTGVNLGNPILFGVLLLVYAPIVIFASTWRQEKLILTNTIVTCTDTSQVEIYSKIFHDNLSSKRHILDSSLDGIISIHSAGCENPLCPCHHIVTMQRLEDDGDDKDAEESMTIKKDEHSSPNLKPAKQKSDKTIENVTEFDLTGRSEICNSYTKFLISEIEAWSTLHEKKARLHLLLGYLKLFCLDNPLASLWEIMAAEEESPDIYDQFHMFRLQYFKHIS